MHPNPSHQCHIPGCQLSGAFYRNGHSRESTLNASHIVTMMTILSLLNKHMLQLVVPASQSYSHDSLTGELSQLNLPQMETERECMYYVLSIV